MFDVQPWKGWMLWDGMGNRALLTVIRAAEDGGRGKFFLLAQSFVEFVEPKRQRLLVLEAEAAEEGNGSVLAKTIVKLK